MTDTPEPQPLRAVLDTNIVLSAFLTRHATSPARELIAQRWPRGEWTWLVSDEGAAEMAEKLNDRHVDPETLQQFLTRLARLAEWVEVADVPAVLRDPDDDHILACAVQGRADYLVTHDKDFDPLGGTYQGVKIVPTLPFLWAVRGDTLPDPAVPPSRVG